jgi:hypothetical protein
MINKTTFRAFLFFIAACCYSYSTEQEDLSSVAVRPHLNTLPDEIVLAVFKYLAPRDLEAIGKTDRHLYGLSKDKLLLSALFKEKAELLGQATKGNTELSANSSSPNSSCVIDYALRYWQQLESSNSAPLPCDKIVPLQLTWKFLQVFSAFSHSPPAILQDLNGITVTDDQHFKKVLSLGIYGANLLPQSLSTAARRTLINTCLSLTPEQISVRSKTIHMLLTKNTRETDRSVIISACLNLSPEQIKAIGGHAGHLFTKKMNGAGRSAIISACLGLTPEQIEATGMNAHNLFRSNMNGKRRSEVIKNLVKVTPEKIALRAKTHPHKKPTLA